MTDVGDLLFGVIGAEGVDAAEHVDALEAIELVTTDASGWPHVAWLSAGELLAIGPQTLAACLWPASTTTTNLQDNGRGLVHVVVDGRVLKLQVEARRLPDIPVGDRVFAAFALDVVGHEGDDVAYADVLGGPRYRLTDVHDVLPRWRTQLAALADLA